MGARIDGGMLMLSTGRGGCGLLFRHEALLHGGAQLLPSAWMARAGIHRLDRVHKPDIACIGDNEVVS